VARRLTRKQIKQDDFVTVIDELIHWLSENWRQAAMGLGGALLVGLVYWGFTAFLGARNDSAAQALSTALAQYEAPVGSSAPANATVKFNTDSERLAAAETAFHRVASRYWLTPQSRIAKLYLARIEVERGEREKAIQLLGELSAKHSTDPVVRLAMLDLVRLRLAKGETSELVPELEAMASGQDPRLPRDTAMFELAKVWERAGKPAEATKTYRKLLEDFPESPYAMEARQRVSSAS
jgi:predicted Zn-dependent protease